MSSRPAWIKFDLDDFCEDPQVKLCPLDTQGWYLHLMKVLSRSKPYGYLLVNGSEPPGKLLHTLTGYPPQTCNKHLAILKKNGVLRKDEKGWHSKRMITDWLEYQQNREYGLKGAEAKKGKTLKPPLEAPPEATPSGNKNKNKNKNKNINTYGQVFDEIIWPEIWEKVTKTDSRRMVVSLLESGVSADTLLAGISEYKRTANPGYMMNPSRFFGRGEHWREYAEKASEHKTRIAENQAALAKFQPEEKPKTPEELARARAMADEIKRGALRIAAATETRGE